jgi:Ran GTPase-activating protein (RanGAP) involved in mRNA processing and transport
MREGGMALECAKVLADVLKYSQICHLDVGKNNLGHEGLVELTKGIRLSKNLVHIDLGSNDINHDSAGYLFRQIHKHQTISSITLANHDRLHRNRMSAYSCNEMRDLLLNNKIVSSINISDNGIGNMGLKLLEPALEPK